MIIESIENKVATLKHEVDDLKKKNKENLDNIRVAAGANSKLVAQLLKTLSDIVERVDILEELQTNTKEPTTERDSKKYDDNKENSEADSKN